MLPAFAYITVSFKTYGVEGPDGLFALSWQWNNFGWQVKSPMSGRSAAAAAASAAGVGRGDFVTNVTPCGVRVHTLRHPGMSFACTLL